jgi:hypothetical protein
VRLAESHVDAAALALLAELGCTGHAAPTSPWKARFTLCEIRLRDAERMVGEAA